MYTYIVKIINIFMIANYEHRQIIKVKINFTILDIYFNFYNKYFPYDIYTLF